MTGCGCSQLLDVEELKEYLDIPLVQIAVSDLTAEYDYQKQGRTRRFKLIGPAYFPLCGGKVGYYREVI